MILVGLCVFEMVPKLIRNDVVGARMQAVAALPILIGWCILAVDYLPTVLLSTPPVLIWLPLSGLLLALSTRACGGDRLYRKAAALAAAVAWTSQLMTQATPVTAFLCLLFSMGMVVAGFRCQERALVATGIVGTIFALGYHLRFTVHLYDYSPWGVLAVMGIGMLLTASYFEKRAAWMFGRLVVLREEMKGWQ